MKVHRGKHHTYLAMDLDYLHNGGWCYVTMYGYLDGILRKFDKAVQNHGEGWVVVKARVAKRVLGGDVG